MDAGLQSDKGKGLWVPLQGENNSDAMHYVCQKVSRGPTRGHSQYKHFPLSLMA